MAERIAVHRDGALAMSMRERVTATKHSFLALDGLRGVAAIAVMVYHFSPFLGAQLFPQAYLAVDFFFMLSGFVIAHAYDDRLLHGMGLGRFTLVRLVRLYPLYALGTVLGVAYEVMRTAILHQSHASIGLMARTLVAAIFFVPILHRRAALGGLYPFDPAAWSLFFELLVNVLYAMAIAHLTMRRVMVLLGVMAAGIVAAAIIGGSLDKGMTAATLAGGRGARDVGLRRWRGDQPQARAPRSVAGLDIAGIGSRPAGPVRHTGTAGLRMRVRSWLCDAGVSGRHRAGGAVAGRRRPACGAVRTVIVSGLYPAHAAASAVRGGMEGDAAL